MADNRKNPLTAFVPVQRTPSAGPLDGIKSAVKSNAPNNVTVDGRSYSTANSDWREMWPVREGIDGSRWNKSFPYQLLILEANNGSYSPAISTNVAKDLKSTSFTLPIPPQAMALSTPFAIDLSVTLGGVVEQHNGAPLRMLSFSGTTGVAPLRGTGEIASTNSLPMSIAVGTIQAVNDTIKSATALTGNPTNERLMGETQDELMGTGYYQFRLLQDFLESYVRAKKKSKYANLRLAVAIWKDEAVYLVTPVSFDVQRNASQPWLYNYSLNFRAFRRVNLDASSINPIASFLPVTRDPDAMRYALTKIRQARALLRNRAAIVKAVVADADRLVDEPLRETALFLKDALGTPLSVADVTNSIGKQILSSWLSSVKSFEASASGSWSKLIEKTMSWGGNLSAETNRGLTGAGTSAPPPRGTSYNEGAHELNKIFDNIRSNHEFFDSLRLTDVNLPVKTQGLIQAERHRIRTLTRKDFEAYRDQLQTVAATFAESIGAGDPVYNQTYGTPEVAIRKSNPSDDDYEILHSLNDSVLQLNRLAADTEVTAPKITTSELVAGMAAASGIAFRVPMSKYPVPLTYGQTLEQLSSQYLGDPDRWIEIATLNGLQSPYIDEEGFVSKLTVNGSNATIQVEKNGNYFQGQPVWVSSSKVIREKRYVEHVTSDDDYTYLTLAGEPDMSRLDVNDDAQVWAFLPNTANSQQLIYIPSNDPIPEEYSTPAIPGLSDYDNEIRVGGVSLLLTGDGDLALTPDGQSRLAIGVTNVLQRIRVAIGTTKGSLLRHPEYGLGVQVGASSAELDAKAIAASLKSLLSNDPAVSDIRDVHVLKQGPVLRIRLSIQLAGVSRLIPISVDVASS